MADITIPGAEQAASGWDIIKTLQLLGMQGQQGITPGPYTPPPGPTAEQIKQWAQGMGISEWVGQWFVSEMGYLPRNVPELEQWLERHGWSGLQTGAAPGAGKYKTINGERTVQQMRDELYMASGRMDYWKNAPDSQVISEYGKVTGGPVTPINLMPTAPEMPPYPDWWRQLADYGLPSGPQQGVYPTIEMQEILGDPSRIAQGLMLLYGGDDAKAKTASYLQGTPLVRQLMGYPEVTAQVMPGGQRMGSPTPYVPQPAQPTGQFQFVRGRNLPMRETLQQFQQQQTGGASPLLDLYGSLAAFSGQNVGDFYGDFWSAAPQGGKNPLTRWAY